MVAVKAAGADPRDWADYIPAPLGREAAAARAVADGGDARDWELYTNPYEEPENQVRGKQATAETRAKGEQQRAENEAKLKKQKTEKEADKAVEDALKEQYKDPYYSELHAKLRAENVSEEKIKARLGDAYKEPTVEDLLKAQYEDPYYAEAHASLRARGLPEDQVKAHLGDAYKEPTAEKEAADKATPDPTPNQLARYNDAMVAVKAAGADPRDWADYIPAPLGREAAAARAVADGGDARDWELYTNPYEEPENQVRGKQATAETRAKGEQQRAENEAKLKKQKTEKEAADKATPDPPESPGTNIGADAKAVKDLAPGQPLTLSDGNEYVYEKRPDPNKPFHVIKSKDGKSRAIHGGIVPPKVGESPKSPGTAKSDGKPPGTGFEAFADSRGTDGMIDDLLAPKKKPAKDDGKVPAPPRSPGTKKSSGTKKLKKQDEKIKKKYPDLNSNERAMFALYAAAYVDSGGDDPVIIEALLVAEASDLSFDESLSLVEGMLEQ